MPQIINLAEINHPANHSCYVSKSTSKSRVIYDDSYDENLEHLITSYPNKILFNIKEVANQLSVSYEFVRYSVNNGYIKAKLFGKRKLIHRGELARIITEGINNNVSKEK